MAEKEGIPYGNLQSAFAAIMLFSVISLHMLPPSPPHWIWSDRCAVHTCILNVKGNQNVTKSTRTFSMREQVPRFYATVKVLLCTFVMCISDTHEYKHKQYCSLFSVKLRKEVELEWSS